MIAFVSIAAGYAALIAVTGWWGVAAAGVHILVMLWAAGRSRQSGFR